MASYLATAPSTGSPTLSAHAWITAGGRVVQGGPVGHVTPLAVLR